MEATMHHYAPFIITYGLVTAFTAIIGFAMMYSFL
jgi:hypothetical protein